VCLQEIKCVDEAFPREPLEALGYNVAVHGQKAFNGVAVLSKSPLDDVTPRLPGDDGDAHARFLEAVISTKHGALRVASVYLPNGNPPDTDKYSYKIKWMDRLIQYACERLQLEEPLILAGDFNVIPSARDARNPDRWVGDALFLPRTREKFRALCNLGLTDAVRARERRSGPLHLLGLPGRRLAEERRDPHRPSAAVAAGRRSAGRRRDRQARPRLGKAVGSRAGLGRPRRQRLKKPSRTLQGSW
jgi:exodeoxyribonuclease III